MTVVIVDTNVVCVANKQHDVSEACLKECIEGLQWIIEKGTVVLDDDGAILSEYLKNAEPFGRAPRPGDKFIKWVAQQLGSARVHRIPVKPAVDGLYSEFPCAELQEHFDPSDRKFPTVANLHPRKPEIWQAVDCKWVGWWEALKSAGITVRFLCPDDICEYYHRKFPERGQARLP